MELDINQFQNDLLGWFSAEKRELPWRETSDPYRIWVSEIMLQQTRVDTVIPFYHRFLEQFPTLQSLAEADEQHLLKTWEGLGYYSRARNLQAGVKEVAETYGGIVPDRPADIAALKGVGPYTAGAVLSIAYGIPEPAVDGNVMRVLSRILVIDEDIAKPKTRKTFEEAVRKLISHDDPSSFNQGLMELGALICTPTSPKCLLCPVREHCGAFDEGRQHELPVKTKAKKNKSLRMVMAAVREGDLYLMEQRPAQGLLANMWQFPLFETKGALLPLEVEEHLSQTLGGVMDGAEKITSFKHVFSHITWEVDGFTVRGTGLSVPAHMKWVHKDALEKLPMANPVKKMMTTMKERGELM